MKPFLRSLIIFTLLSFVFCYNDALAASFRVGGIRVNKDVKNWGEIKNQNVVRQSLDYSCGAAGLSTVMKYYLQDPITEHQIIDTLLKFVDLEKVQQRRGFSLLDLKKFAQARGYKVTGYKMDFDFLRNLGKPVLVPIKFKNYRHFVIVRAVIGDRVFLADPAMGNLTVKTHRFEKMWLKGIGLLVEQIDSKTKIDYPMEVTEKELFLADHTKILKNIQQTAIRTAIFTNEW